jgi:hypothetical protein
VSKLFDLQLAAASRASVVQLKDSPRRETTT